MFCLRVSQYQYPDQEEDLALSGKLQVLTDIMIEDGTETMVEAVLGAVIEGNLERFGINLTAVLATISTAQLSAAVVKVRDF